MTNVQDQLLPSYHHQTGTGPTLVFLHYWGGSGRTWDGVRGDLGGRAALTVDFRGWGDSAGLPGPYSLRQYAEDTMNVVAEAGLTDWILVGHSMGGKVAQIIAGQNPAGLRGLVLVAPAPAKPNQHITAGLQEQMSHGYDTAESIEGAIDHILTAKPISNELRAQVVTDSQTSAVAAQVEWPWHGMIEDVTSDAAGIKVPTLVLVGEADGIDTIQVLKEGLLPYVKGASLSVIPGAGHLLPLEAPSELASEIATFTQSLAINASA